MKENEHTCVTNDGVPIKVGLRVRDYDGKLGTVTRPPDSWDVCDGRGWSGFPHPDGSPGLSRGCWWGVTPDGCDNSRDRAFDGSRLTTRGVPQPKRETIIVKRRFAVILEDAFRVEAPSAEELAEFDGDIDAWALGKMDNIYTRAHDPVDSTVASLWGDRHHADLDFPDDEILIEEDS